MKGRQEIETPVGKDGKLHPFEYPVRSSPHADKGRRGADMARQAKERSKQKAPE